MLLGWLTGPDKSDARWLFRWRLARATALAVVATSLLIMIAVYVHTPPHADRSDLIGMMFAAALSGAVGFAELNVTELDQRRVAGGISGLIATGDAMTDPQRSVILGTYLMQVVGPQVLARAVTALGDSITIGSRP